MKTRVIKVNNTLEISFILNGNDISENSIEENERDRDNVYDYIETVAKFVGETNLDNLTADCDIFTLTIKYNSAKGNTLGRVKRFLLNNPYVAITTETKEENKTNNEEVKEMTGFEYYEELAKQENELESKVVGKKVVIKPVEYNPTFLWNKEAEIIAIASLNVVYVKTSDKQEQHKLYLEDLIIIEEMQLKEKEVKNIADTITYYMNCFKKAELENVKIYDLLKDIHKLSLLEIAEQLKQIAEYYNKNNKTYYFDKDKLSKITTKLNVIIANIKGQEIYWQIDIRTHDNSKTKNRISYKTIEYDGTRKELVEIAKKWLKDNNVQLNDIAFTLN